MDRRVPISKPIFEPRWEEGFLPWTRDWVRLNHWRVKHILPEPEDAIQFCALRFSVITKNPKYRGIVDNAAWYMRIFKEDVQLEWITLSHKNTKRRSFHSDKPIEDCYDSFSVGYNMGMLALRLSECSKEARDVLRMIASGPREVVETLFAGKSSALREIKEALEINDAINRPRVVRFNKPKQKVCAGE